MMEVMKMMVVVVSDDDGGCGDGGESPPVMVVNKEHVYRARKFRGPANIKNELGGL